MNVLPRFRPQPPPPNPSLLGSDILLLPVGPVRGGGVKVHPRFRPHPSPYHLSGAWGWGVGGADEGSSKEIILYIISLGSSQKYSNVQNRYKKLHNSKKDPISFLHNRHKKGTTIGVGSQRFRERILKTIKQLSNLTILFGPIGKEESKVLFLTHPTLLILYCSFFYKHKMFLVLSCSKKS